MKSFCLNHQDREADFRCTTCLKPLCGECARETPEGCFCSEECRLNALKSQERFADMKARDAAAREAARRAALVRAVTAVAVLGALVLGGIMAWPHLPDSVRKPVTKIFRSLGR